ncbi:hypothetical protein SKAU_G00389990 [Synaphobranchus kaupii]|uniref:Uncharacterized protein n=1 Tax=Synaphobranchus kaupii TaxID=118154 RepID=A0A9Q1IDI7_SYNKA|nr:hypothetical protein SKAU_G00389990 [Synaphobranchus kaupii]
MNVDEGLCCRGAEVTALISPLRLSGLDALSDVESKADWRVGTVSSIRGGCTAVIRLIVCVHCCRCPTVCRTATVTLLKCTMTHDHRLTPFKCLGSALPPDHFTHSVFDLPQFSHVKADISEVLSESCFPAPTPKPRSDCNL